MELSAWNGFVIFFIAVLLLHQEVAAGLSQLSKTQQKQTNTQPTKTQMMSQEHLQQPQRSNLLRNNFKSDSSVAETEEPFNVPFAEFRRHKSDSNLPQYDWKTFSDDHALPTSQNNDETSPNGMQNNNMNYDSNSFGKEPIDSAMPEGPASNQQRLPKGTPNTMNYNNNDFENEPINSPLRPPAISHQRPPKGMPNTMNYNINDFENEPFDMPLPSSPPVPMPKLLPLIGYAQSVFIPFPLYISAEMFYPTFPGVNNEIEDMVMSRAAGGRRPTHSPNSYQRNSPIYYVRLPPTPYMFVPNMSPNPFGNGFSPLLTYQPMPTFSSFGSVFNLPVNFLANGKPSSVYQMGGTATDIQNAAQQQYPNFGGFNARPPTPTNPYRPTNIASSGSYVPQQSFGLASMPPPQHDSKLTSIKRPYFFNGRPEDIYILPNNFNHLYPENSYY